MTCLFMIAETAWAAIKLAREASTCDECQFADDAALLVTAHSVAVVVVTEFANTARDHGLNLSFT